MIITPEQKKKMKEAFEILRETFPDDGLQVSFNLTPKSNEHYNKMSYNLKLSGVG